MTGVTEQGCCSHVSRSGGREGGRGALPWRRRVTGRSSPLFLLLLLTCDCPPPPHPRHTVPTSTAHTVHIVALISAFHVFFLIQTWSFLSLSPCILEAAHVTFNPQWLWFVTFLYLFIYLIFFPPLFKQSASSAIHICFAWEWMNLPEHFEKENSQNVFFVLWTWTEPQEVFLKKRCTLSFETSIWIFVNIWPFLSKLQPRTKILSSAFFS